MTEEPFNSECNTLTRDFQILLRVEGSPIPVKGMGNFSGFFLSGGGNLARSGFDHWNLFRSYKQHFVNIENRLKSKFGVQN